ncbi:MAG: hypothetical protein M1531_04575 [Chloroflexi bacterium]|nr:hypothetical protein [Chloroflexota bacterium]
MLHDLGARKRLAMSTVLALVVVLATCAGPGAALPPATGTPTISVALPATPTSAITAITPAVTPSPSPAATSPAITPTTAPTPTISTLPASPPTTSAAATVQVAQNATLGSILVDSSGMTLYIFKNDTPGQSNCNDGCAQLWPPLTVPAGTQPTAATGIPGKLATIARQDGSTQVTYDNAPLYHYSGDSKAGDTNGQGIGNVWFVVQTTTTVGSPTPGR